MEIQNCSFIICASNMFTYPIYKHTVILRITLLSLFEYSLKHFSKTDDYNLTAKRDEEVVRLITHSEHVSIELLR